MKKYTFIFLFLITVLGSSFIASTNGSVQDFTIYIDNESGLPNIDGTISSGEYQSIYPVAKLNMTLYFEHNGTHIFIGIEAKTHGWFGIGWIEGISMKNGSNIVILAYNEITGPIVSDDVGTAYNTHETDISQGGTNDISQFAVTETTDHTYAEFCYPMITNDINDVNLTIDNTYGFFCSFSLTDSLTDKHEDFAYINGVTLSDSFPPSTSASSNDQSTSENESPDDQKTPSWTLWVVTSLIAIVFINRAKKKRLHS